MGNKAKQMRGDRTLLDVIRVLMLLQAAIFVVTGLEATVAIAFGGSGLVPMVLINWGFAITMLALVVRVRRRSRMARKLTLLVEIVVGFLALIDLALSILIAQQGLGLVAVLTRIVLPVTIFRLLRRPLVRAYFQKYLPPPPAPPEAPLATGRPAVTVGSPL